MRRLTWAWTRRHTSAGLLVAVAALASLAGLVEGPPVAYWVAGVVALTAVAALALDAFGGIVVGLAGAAALVTLRRLTGHWAFEDFTPALVETVAVCLCGAVAGATGSVLRGQGAIGVQTTALQPVFGSLGLLSADAATARLEEEVTRAVAHRRPLSLAVFDIVTTDPLLPEPGVEAARRAVARIIESRVGESDVPFALSADRLSVILPEASTATAWDIVGDILDAVARGRFLYGTDRIQRALGEAIDMHVGLATLGTAHPSWDTLLDSAITAVEASGRSEPVQ